MVFLPFDSSLLLLDNHISLAHLTSLNFHASSCESLISHRSSIAPHGSHIEPFRSSKHHESLFLFMFIAYPHPYTQILPLSLYHNPFLTSLISLLTLFFHPQPCFLLSSARARPTFRSKGAGTRRAIWEERVRGTLNLESVDVEKRESEGLCAYVPKKINWLIVWFAQEEDAPISRRKETVCCNGGRFKCQRFGV